MRILLCLLCLIPISLYAAETPQQFLDKIARQAKDQGVREETIKKYLSPVKLSSNKTKVPNPGEPKDKRTLSYFNNHYINRRQIDRGQARLRNYRFLLRRMQYDFHVQPRFLIAIWGVRSHYGSDQGSAPFVQSLANMAFYYAQEDSAQRELIDALKILDRPYVIKAQLKSSLRGEMGAPQFLPSMYLKYAVDYEREGFANIWSSIADTLASIANFLHENDWKDGAGWGMPVKLPNDFPYAEAGAKQKTSIKHWKQLGVTQPDGQPLPNVKGNTAIILPNDKKGPAYLVLPNYFVLLQWKMSETEALAIGILADRFMQQE